MKTVYLNIENKATLVCPQCEKAKIIDASKFVDKDGPIKIKFTFKCRHCYCGTEHADGCDGTNCKQGNTISALLERRKAYRKSVNLSGRIMDEQGKEALVKVLDISKNGLLFKLVDPGITYEKGETLTVFFELDDPQQSKINKDVVVRKKIGADQLGVEFTRIDAYSQADKAIGFYLMN
jgi:hypothetical protein